MHARENTAGPGRRLWIPLFAALALVLVSNLPGASGDARAATQAQCIAKFNQVPRPALASSTPPPPPRTTARSEGSAGPRARAARGCSVSITVSLDDADDLQNCSGTLAVSC